MEINECLLNSRNPRVIDGCSIGRRIENAGKECLWGPRPAGAIDVVVVHYISAAEVVPDDPFNEEAILKRLCDRGVSAHYLIDRDGRIQNLVPEQERAWHAGGSIMPPPDGRLGVNDFSVGIELVATEDSGFTPVQYESLSWLVSDISRRLDRVMTVVGHQDVAGSAAVERLLRSDLKTDPGALFDWTLFLGLTRAKGGRIADGREKYSLI